eukprot:TRINITY_DN7753_c0_g1_i5.p2 TRINITY_DN7753_c0_g1~~TRINITY_DN7753_c0_g1_i5.p2  ORF type:complete len:245 (-),score=51.27 TRINITY_DN7753_c0_g1_i5:1700-2374(-)
MCIRDSHSAGAHTGTLIWLHGLGDSAEGFASFFEGSYSPLPSTVKVVLLTAPLRAVTINRGYRMNSWYDIKAMERDEATEANFDNYVSVKEVLESEETIKKNLKDEIAILGDSKKVFLGGFSQGCCMSLHVGLGFDQPLGGIIGLSGFLFPISKVNPANAKTPVMLSHGVDDDLISVDLAKRSYTKIDRCDRYVYDLFIEDLGHSVNEETIEGVRTFFKKITSQ